MATTVVGRVSNARDAESVVQDLVSTCSCDRADISLITQKVPRSAESGRAEFGTLKGIAGGIIVGGIAGYVAAAASLPVPEVFAKVIAAGPIHSAILGGFIFSVAFGVMGALIGAAARGGESDYYPDNARHPGALIMVHARSDREAECVVNVMRQHPVMEITKRSSNGEKPANRSTVADPLMRADPKLSAGNPTATGSPSLRSNRLSEPFATALAGESAAKPISRAGWITRKYTATYYGPERRTAPHPYQGAERRQSA